MMLEEFNQKMLDEVGCLLDSSYSVEIRPIHKNNVGEVLALCIIDRERREIIPNFYLGQLFERFKEGSRSIRELAKDIVAIYRKAVAENRNCGLLEGIRQENWVRERLIFRVLNYRGNEEILQKAAHVKFLDMALVYYALVQEDEDEDGMKTVRISKDLFREFGWQEKTMWKDALENTMRLLPVHISTLPEALRSRAEGKSWEQEEPDEAFGGNVPLVITNRRWMNGAVAIIYPGVLRNIAQRQSGNLILIPASIHEVIVFFDDGETDLGEVNNRCVLPEEVLSENVYYYDYKENSLCSGTMRLDMQWK